MAVESFISVNPLTALFTLCNMIITFLVLRKFLFRPVKKMIDARQKEIDDLYADADHAREEAAKLQESYAQKLLSTKEEAAQILRDATASAKKAGDEIVKAAEEESSALREKANRDIALERRKAMQEAKQEISGLAVQIASKVVQKEIDETTHDALIAQFIDELGDKA